MRHYKSTVCMKFLFYAATFIFTQNALYSANPQGSKQSIAKHQASKVVSQSNKSKIAIDFSTQGKLISESDLDEIQYATVSSKEEMARWQKVLKGSNKLKVVFLTMPTSLVLNDPIELEGHEIEEWLKDTDAFAVLAGEAGTALNRKYTSYDQNSWYLCKENNNTYVPDNVLQRLA